MILFKSILNFVLATVATVDAFKLGSAVSRAQRIAEHTGWEAICQYAVLVGFFGGIDFSDLRCMSL